MKKYFSGITPLLSTSKQIIAKNSVNLRHAAIIKCSQQNGCYVLKLTIKDSLKNSKGSCAVFIDSKTKNEIAWLKITDEGLILQVQSVPIKLHIDGTLDGSSYIFENHNSSIHLIANFSSDDPVNLQINANKFTYIGAITSKDNLIWNAAVQDNLCELVLEKECIISVEDWHISAQKFKNHSPLILANNFYFNIANEFINYPSGAIKAKDKLIIKGFNLWNAGKISYDKLDVMLNGICVHGYSCKNDLLNTLKHDHRISTAELTGKYASVIAGLFVYIPSTITGNLWSLTAIAEINLGGMTTTAANCKSRILAFNTGIDLPNPKEILSNLQYYVDMYQRNGLSTTATKLMTWNSLQKLSSFIRWLLRTFIPAVAKPTDLAWSLITLLANSPRLLKQCSELYYQKQKIEPYQIYSLLNQMSNMSNQVLFSKMLIDSVIHGVDPVQVHVPSATPGILVADIASLFLPANYDEAAVGMNMGLHANATLQNRKGLQYSKWNAQLALNISDTFLYEIEDQCFTTTNNINYSGYQYAHSGITYANNHYTNVVEQIESGNIHANQAYWQAFTINLKEVANLDLTDGYLSADNLKIEGDIHATGDLVINGDQAFSTTANSHIHTQQLAVKSKNINLAGEAGAAVDDNVVVLQGDEINLNGKLTAETLFVKGNKNLKLSDHTLIGDGYLESANLEMQDHSHIQAEGALSVTSQAASLSQIDVKDLQIQFANITDVEDLLLTRGVFKDVHARENLYVRVNDSVILHENMNLTYGLGLIAQEIVNQGSILTARDLIFLSTVGNVIAANDIHAQGILAITSKETFHNNDKINLSGDKLFVQAQNDIINNGGIWQSKQLTQIASRQGNIINRCLQWDTQTLYPARILDKDETRLSPDIQYQPGQIIGGDGKDYDGYGLYLGSKGKITNDASFIYSVGDNYISGSDGIESVARYNYHISFYRHYENSWRKEDHTTISPHIQPAIISSLNGDNYLISAEGPIHSISTTFVANISNYFSSKGNILTEGFIVSGKDERTSQNILTKDSPELSITNYPIPTQLVSIDKTNIVSLNNVTLRDTIAISGGNTTIKGKNVEITGSILNNYSKEKTTIISGQGPGVSSIPGVELYHDTKALAASQNGLARALNTSNLVIDSLNTMVNIATSLKNGTITPAFCPSVGVNLTQTTTTTHSQTISSDIGISVGGSLIIEADNKVSFNNGVPIIVNNDASITATTFEQNGVALHNSVNVHSVGVNASINLAGTTTAGANAGGSNMDQTIYQNQTFTVGGTLDVNVKSWNLENANTNAGNLQGKADKLSIRTGLNTTRTSSWNASADTCGNVSYQQSKIESDLIGTISGIHASNNIHADIGSTYLEGGTITADGENHYKTGSIESVDVNEHSSSKSFGIATNVNSYGACCSAAIPTLNISKSDSEYRATQSNTTFGAAGTDLQVGHINGHVNTSNADGLVVTRDEENNYEAKVPIITSSGVQQVKDSFNFLADGISSSVSGFFNRSRSVNQGKSKEAYTNQNIQDDNYTIIDIDANQPEHMHIPSPGLNFDDVEVMAEVKSGLGNRAAQEDSVTFENADPNLVGITISTNDPSKLNRDIPDDKALEEVHPELWLWGSLETAKLGVGLGKIAARSGKNIFSSLGFWRRSEKTLESISIPEERIAHIFRNKEGHLLNTPENHQLLKSVAEDKSAILGKDKFGNIWSATTNQDGTQIWVQIRNGKIINGGLNLRPKFFHPATGLSRPLRKPNK